MPVEVILNTPLADRLNTAIQPKLVEVGWGSGGSDDSALAEYIVLMLVNGKTQDQIAAELSGELLGLPADDPVVRQFAVWLFEQIDSLNAQLNGGQAAGGDAVMDAPQDVSIMDDVDTTMMTTDAPEPQVPTGPRSMRNANANGNVRGGRDKRAMGQSNRATDRPHDGALHRTRGNDRINTHGRAAPTGPRNGRPMRQQNVNGRGGGMQAGPSQGVPPGGWMMPGQPSNQMELMAMLEQQNKIMYQLSQQLMSNGGGANGGYGQQRRGGKHQFDRGSDGHQQRKNARQHQHQHQQAAGAKASEDVDMSGGQGEAANPDESVCKYNLRCTNKECKFAHQSPAAPVGAPVDVADTCSFGAACKNRKCVGRHPSPAARLAHQGEQDCKFFPNCQNPRCPFKHPSMPMCRNGPGCSTADCKFTHVKTKCRFNPCLNPTCVFAHDAGQHGGFRDKVWTAESGGEHVSERKFVDDDAPVEQVTPGQGGQEAPTTGEHDGQVMV
ncbi:hypothetical protein DCS_07967 [Drechmeria coniospora]|uniref:Nab2-like CCCH zinc finger domain-containing protein n=1 Tax=Drechmeria coniospora TaxID=98403 RepID=A0A151GG09_DRECN|nr:hypothetical protein DCS_07967 [Drechmeria coniospora]KYK56002.1 hypothetical protein DCS_07967 [Drechmeria coniospora]